ncbi:MAG: hypothetical protein AAF570_26440 [Bacteroidota bacterium]
MKHLLLFLSMVLPATFASAQRLHSPAELIEIMQESRMAYVIEMTERQVADAQRGPANTEFTRQILKDNRVKIEDYPVDDEVVEFLNAGAELLEAGDLEAARSKYMELHEKHPDFSVPMTYIGLTYTRQEFYSEAEIWFEKAVEANYMDYLAHWWRAENYLLAKELGHAASEIALAWVLNRNHEALPEAVQRIFKAAKLKFQPMDFEPNYRLQNAGNEVRMTFSEDWMMYAVCKALWRYEPGYRKKMGGGDPEFNLMEEKECLLNLLLAHHKTNGKKKSKLKSVNILQRAVDGQFINEYIFFEVWLPQEPLIIFAQPRAAVELMAKYLIEIRGKKK